MINKEQNGGKRPNIYLIGFMGVGKSTVGRRLARKLGMLFIDSDAAIEVKAGKTVNEIFAQDGEKIFREMEREFIKVGHPGKGCVVACGGGLPIEEGMLELLRERGMVIGLFARSETILERTDRRDTRPMLNVENKEERINDLLKKRRDLYQKADYLFFSEGRPVEVVVADIVRVYLKRMK
ncbi:MAG: shikimate kinase [Verrucomicrobia bacterium]|nr:MAG: shikimate kinase [Verrucomicrobiota bacterium]